MDLVFPCFNVGQRRAALAVRSTPDATENARTHARIPTNRVLTNLASQAVYVKTEKSEHPTDVALTSQIAAVSSKYFLRILVLHFFLEALGKQCPANEVFSACDKNCEFTCEQPGAIWCSGICVPGCVCRGDYVRAREGFCVLRNKCKS
jgi:Trypsin Inhibitor like cysteine rich domain